MGVHITTGIKKTVSSVGESEVTINNVIQGLDSDNPLVTSEDLVVDHVDVKSWTLDQTQAAAFNLDIMTLIDVATLAEVAFVHIQCHKVITSNTERATPIRFDLDLGANNLGKVSQFSVFDLEDFQHNGITVSDITIGNTTKAILTVVFGLNKA